MLDKPRINATSAELAFDAAQLLTEIKETTAEVQNATEAFYATFATQDPQTVEDAESLSELAFEMHRHRFPYLTLRPVRFAIEIDDDGAPVVVALVPLSDTSEAALFARDYFQRVIARGASGCWNFSTGKRDPLGRVTVQLKRPGTKTSKNSTYNTQVAHLIMDREHGDKTEVKFIDGDHTNLRRNNLYTQDMLGNNHFYTKACEELFTKLAAEEAERRRIDNAVRKERRKAEKEGLSDARDPG